MARRLRGLERVLDVPSLAAVAYGEVGSSISSRSGSWRCTASGVTPWVLARRRLPVLPRRAVLRRRQRRAPRARRRSGVRPAGVQRSRRVRYGVGALPRLPDRDRPRRAVRPALCGSGLGWEAVRTGRGTRSRASGSSLRSLASGSSGARSSTPSPWRSRRSPSSRSWSLVVLGFAFLFSTGDLSAGIELGKTPTWDSLVFSLVARDACLHRAGDRRQLGGGGTRAGPTLPRSLFAAIGAVVVVTTLAAIVGVAAYPVVPSPAAPDGVATASAPSGCDAPLVGIAAALESHVGGEPRTSCGCRSRSRASSSSSGRSHVDLGPRPPGVRPGQHGNAAARLRPPQRRTLIAPAAIVTAAVARMRVSARGGRARPAGAVPRQPLQLRHPPRLLRRAARGDPAPRQEPDLARPFRVAGCDPDPRRRRPVLPTLVGLLLTPASGSPPLRHTRRRAIARAALARARRRRLPRVTRRRRARACSGASSRRPIGHRCRGGGGVRADPRAAEARSDRRGGARHGDPAGGGAARRP